MYNCHIRGNLNPGRQLYLVFFFLFNVYSILIQQKKLFLDLENVWNLTEIIVFIQIARNLQMRQKQLHKQKKITLNNSHTYFNASMFIFWAYIRTPSLPRTIRCTANRISQNFSKFYRIALNFNWKKIAKNTHNFK